MWSVTTERSDHLPGSVSLFVCLAGARGWKENISQTEVLLLTRNKMSEAKIFLRKHYQVGNLKCTQVNLTELLLKTDVVT